MSKQIKLTSKHRDILKDLKNGVPYYFNAITSFQPFTKHSYGMDAKKVHGRNMMTLENLGLIRKERFNQAIYIYSITEAGKNF